MEMVLALMLQGAIALGGTDPGHTPQLSHANDAAQAAPRARVNQGRGFRIDWNALGDSLATESRQERGDPAPPRTAPRRAAPGRTTLWNGVPVRMIEGRPHGVW